MFRLTQPNHAVPATKGRNALRRALLLAGALLLLWIATRLLPGSTPPPITGYSDEAGTLAANVDNQDDLTSRSLVGPGYLLVLLILAGGSAFAFYLHRKSAGGRSVEDPIRALGQLQFAPGQQLRLVACGDDVLLLGVTSGQVTLLKTYPSSSFILSNPEKVELSGIDDSVPALSFPSRKKASFTSILEFHAREGIVAREEQG